MWKVIVTWGMSYPSGKWHIWVETNTFFFPLLFLIAISPYIVLRPVRLEV